MTYYAFRSGTWVYLTLTISLSILVRALERRLQRHRPPDPTK